MSERSHPTKPRSILDWIKVAWILFWLATATLVLFVPVVAAALAGRTGKAAFSLCRLWARWILLVTFTRTCVAGRSHPGSAILMTFMFKSVIDGNHSRQEAGWFRNTLIRKGEPPKFGLKEGAVEAFFSEHGFSQIGYVSMGALKSRYFTGSNSRRKVFPWAGIAHAKEVAGP